MPERLFRKETAVPEKRKTAVVITENHDIPVAVIHDFIFLPGDPRRPARERFFVDPVIDPEFQRGFRGVDRKRKIDGRVVRHPIVPVFFQIHEEFHRRHDGI